MQAVADDGCWLIGDMAALESHTQNVHHHPFAPYMWVDMPAGARHKTRHVLTVVSIHSGARWRARLSSPAPGMLSRPVPAPALPATCRYGFSVHLCLPSGMSAPGAEGLGTLGISEVGWGGARRCGAFPVAAACREGAGSGEDRKSVV